MNEKIDYKDFYNRSTKPNDTWYCRHFLRHISTRISWLILQFFPNINPNTITIMGGVIGFFGALFLISANAFIFLLGSGLLFLWTFLDGVDGEVARYSRKLSVSGAYLDNIVDHLIMSSIFLFSAINLMLNNDALYGVVAFVITFFFLLSRLTIGLRAEILLKSGIQLNKMPKEQISEFKKSTNPLIRLGSILPTIYSYLVTNYILIFIILLIAIINIICELLKINILINVFILFIPYLLVIPMFFGFVYGFYYTLRYKI